MALKVSISRNLKVVEETYGDFFVKAEVQLDTESLVITKMTNGTINKVVSGTTAAAATDRMMAGPGSSYATFSLDEDGRSSNSVPSGGIEAMLRVNNLIITFVNQIYTELGTTEV